MCRFGKWDGKHNSESPGNKTTLPRALIFSPVSSDSQPPISLSSNFSTWSLRPLTTCHASPYSAPLPTTPQQVLHLQSLICKRGPPLLKFSPDPKSLPRLFLIKINPLSHTLLRRHVPQSYWRPLSYSYLTSRSLTHQHTQIFPKPKKAKHSIQLRVFMS